MTNLKFIQALPHEYNTALDLYYKAAAKLRDKKINHWQFWLAPSQEKIDMVIYGFANREYYFVYDGEGDRVGMFRLMNRDPYFWGDMDEYGWYIHALVTDPKYSGQHIGKNIILQIQELAAEQKINLLRLDCNAANDFLCSFYENLGFIKKGQKQVPQSLNNLYEKRFTY